MRFISTALLLPILLASCATAPSGTAQRPVPVEVSKTFRACSAESKRPWLVSVVAADKSNTRPLEALVSDFVGGSQADQSRALMYLNDLRLKKYATEEDMAGAHFNACMGQGKAEKFELTRSVRCYQEQSLLLVLEIMRFDRKASMADATQQMLAANPSADASTQAAIRRLAIDTYTILQPGAESTFAEAEFHVCMTGK